MKMNWKNIVTSPITWIAITALLLMVILLRGNRAVANALPGPDDVLPTSSDYDVRPLVDLVYEKIKGYNFFYYPEIINALADLPDDTLAEAYNYWQQKYSGAMDGDTLTQALQNEAHGGMYDPAIGRLESLNLF